MKGEDWRSLGYDSYADFISGQKRWGGDSGAASRFNRNLIGLLPSGPVQRYVTFAYIDSSGDWCEADFNWEWKGKRYSLKAASGFELGARMLIGCVYIICGVRLFRREEIENWLERYGSGFKSKIDWDAWASVPPILDGGRWNSRYFSIRQFVHLIPPRPRCEHCGKKFSQWDGHWKWQGRAPGVRQVCSLACLETITEREYRAWRADRAKQIRQRRDRQQWNKGRKTLKEIKRFLKQGQAPEASTSQGAECAPGTTSRA